MLRMLGISPKNFLTFSFNLFATFVLNLQAIRSASPKLLNFNREHPSKNRFFWSNPYKIEVMITSLIEMLKLPNFDHMTISRMQFESRGKIMLVTSWTEIMTSQPLFQNVFILRRPRVANFDDIIKIATMFVKKTFKDSKKVRGIRNYVLNKNLYLCFMIERNLLILSEKMLM